MLKPDEAAAKRHHAESPQTLQQTQEKRQLQVRQEVQRLGLTQSVVAGAHQAQHLRRRKRREVQRLNTLVSRWSVLTAGQGEGRHLGHGTALSVGGQRAQRRPERLAVQRHGVVALQTLIQAALQGVT